MKNALVKFDNIGLTFNGATGTIITFPINFSGNVNIQFIWDGNSTALTAPSITLSSGITALNILFSDTGNGFSNTGTTDVVLQMTEYYSISSTGVAQTITLGSGTLPASGVSGDFVLTMMNPNVIS